MKTQNYFYCLLLLSMIFISCDEEDQKSEEIPMESYRDEVQATAVKVGHSEQKSFDYLINATGKIEAASQVMVVVERSGYLVELLVSEGQEVKAGETIARLDNSEIKFELEKAQVELRSRAAEYENQRIGFPSIYDQKDSLLVKDWDDRLRASSGMLTAEIALREAELNLEKSVIKAPISGTVADIKSKKGSLVNNGDEICEILTTGELHMRVKVLESDIGYIKKGQRSEVYPVSGGMEGLMGTVVSINPKVDENGLVQVTLALQKGGTLLPGMNARAVIRAPQTNSLVVPKEAVVYRSGRPVVFTIENSEAIWNYVEVGKDNGREMEILEGIASNKEVIISNNVQLAHQAPVQVLKE